MHHARNRARVTRSVPIRPFVKSGTTCGEVGPPWGDDGFNGKGSDPEPMPSDPLDRVRFFPSRLLAHGAERAA
jgi:hypothetical protein